MSFVCISLIVLFLLFPVPGTHCTSMFFPRVSLFVCFSVASCTYLREYQVLCTFFFQLKSSFVMYIYLYSWVLIDRPHVIIVLLLLENKYLGRHDRCGLSRYFCYSCETSFIGDRQTCHAAVYCSMNTYIYNTRSPSGVVNCSQGVMQEKCINMEKAFAR